MINLRIRYCRTESSLIERRSELFFPGLKLDRDANRLVYNVFTAFDQNDSEKY